MPDEKTQETPAANVSHLTIMDRACKLSRDGYEVFRAMGNLASDVMDLDMLNPTTGLTSVAYNGRLEGVPAADVAQLVAAIAALDQVLSANDRAVAKAIKRLSMFAVPD